MTNIDTMFLHKTKNEKYCSFSGIKYGLSLTEVLNQYDPEFASRFHRYINENVKSLNPYLKAIFIDICFDVYYTVKLYLDIMRFPIPNVSPDTNLNILSKQEKQLLAIKLKSYYKIILYSKMAVPKGTIKILFSRNIETVDQLITMVYKDVLRNRTLS